MMLDTVVSCLMVLGLHTVHGQAASVACICTLEYTPICNPTTGASYGNRCQAVACGGEDPDDLVPGECDAEEPCSCTGTTLALVCNPEKGITFANSCEAECSGEDPADLVDGQCDDPPVDECCTEEEPVCFCGGCVAREVLAFTTCAALQPGATFRCCADAPTDDAPVPAPARGKPRTAPGPQVCEQKPFVVGRCRAAIPAWSFNPDMEACEEFTFGGCGGTENNFDSKEACSAACLETDVEPCSCMLEFAPVCNPEKGITFGNSCEAECAGEDPVDLVDGECEDPPVQVAECCTEEEPFCLCSGGPTSPGFCATARVAARTTCLAVPDGTCCPLP